MEKNAKDIIKDRQAAKKAMVDARDLRLRFAARPEVTAKEARQITELESGQTLDQKVDEAWSRLMNIVKETASSGLSHTTINGVVSVHPSVRSAIVKRLEKAGFQHELAGGQAFIYW